MITQWHHAFSVGLFALYLLILARWHARRTPKVVSGPVDFTLLTLGVGGLALFGPIGQSLVTIFSARPNNLDWLSLASGMTLAALLVSRRAWRRLVIYQIDAATLEQTLARVLQDEDGRFTPTLQGFEDSVHERGVHVDVSPRWRIATIEAYGRDPEQLIHSLERRLVHRLHTTTVPSSRLGACFLVGSATTFLVAIAGLLINQRQVWSAFRDLIERLPGG